MVAKIAKKAANKTVAKKTDVKKTPAKKAVFKKDDVKKEKAVEPKVRIVGDYNLVIVESPSKAKTIKKYLGSGFQVVASNGHIKDLPKSKLGVDVKKNFAIDLVPITGKGDKIERIQELAKNAKVIYLAPDPDREGEAIAFHLKEEIGGKKKFHRVLFNAITKTAVKAAIENPTELDENKYASQQTRRVLDRLVGYKISPILWDKVQRGLSAGRVQSVALRLIVDRDDLIKAFKPEQWFSIHAQFEKTKTKFEAKYYGETVDKKEDLTDPKIVAKILADLKGKNFKVAEVKKKERRQFPTPPFTTSKLQQEAANKLGFTAKKTMMVAQKLYEGVNLSKEGVTGLITYMRTDSVRTEPEALNNLRDYIKKKYGAPHLATEVIEHKKKKASAVKAQDAHESIRPTSLEYSPEVVRGDLEPDEFKLYELIWNKFVASQMSPAVIDQTSVKLEASGHFFNANGSIIKFPGFRTVYLESALEKQSRKGGDDDEDDAKSSSLELPEINQNESLKPLDNPNSLEHWTSPAPRYNEASIVKDMEEKGIGRPSTYASIISNIQDKHYVEKIENRFMPTELGIVVCKMLIESFPSIMDVNFTANIEEQLDLIEEGELNWKKVLKEFWTDFEVTLVKAQDEMKNLKKQEIPTGIKCVKCTDGMYMIKWGRNGQFFACSNYPDCNSTQDFDKDLSGKLTIRPKKYFREKCPTCSSRMEEKTGKFGRFIRCEEYPKCDTTKPYTIDVTCPKCKVGKFAEKKSRYGKIFYGCSNYPECQTAMWDEPKKYPCPKCGHALMGVKFSKRDGHFLACPECKHRVDIKETPFAKEYIKEETVN